ncbi:YdgA family protein [Achromobacter aloeverae]|nr:DUF945 family protein [Achromobacter aloeverae]
MKRTSGLLILLLMLGGGWLEISWYIGKRAQRASQQWVEDADRRLHAAVPGIPLSIEPVSYERGLLSSHARYALRLRLPEVTDVPAPPSSGQDLAWASVDINHGPYPLRPANSLDGKPGARGGALFASSRVVIEIKGAPALAAALDIPQPMPLATIDARVDYAGGATVQWRMPPWRSGTQGPYVNWHGATGQGRLEPDGAMHMTARAEGLTAGTSTTVAENAATESTAAESTATEGTATEGTATESTATEGTATATSALTGLTLKLELAAGDFVLRPGTVDIEIARWRDTFLDDEGKAQSWEARDLHWHSEVTQDSGGQDLRAAYRLGALRIGARALGQGSGRLALTHLDGDALTRAWDNARLLASALVLGQVAPDAVSEAVTNLSRAALALLDHQPRLALEAVTWQPPHGDQATLDMALRMGPAPDHALNISPLWAVLDRMRDFEFKAHVPGALLGDLPGLRAPLLETGFFADDGTGLAAALHAAEDRATINGVEMPTTQWLARYAGTRPAPGPLPQSPAMPTMPARP